MVPWSKNWLATQSMYQHRILARQIFPPRVGMVMTHDKYFPRTYGRFRHFCTAIEMFFKIWMAQNFRRSSQNNYTNPPTFPLSLPNSQPHWVRELKNLLGRKRNGDKRNEGAWFFSSNTDGMKNPMWFQNFSKSKGPKIWKHSQSNMTCFCTSWCICQFHRNLKGDWYESFGGSFVTFKGDVILSFLVGDLEFIGSDCETVELLFSLVCWKKVRGSASRFGPRRVPCFKGNWSIIPIWTKSMHFLLNIAELLDPFVHWTGHKGCGQRLELHINRWETKGTTGTKKMVIAWWQLWWHSGYHN